MRTFIATIVVLLSGFSLSATNLNFEVAGVPVTIDPDRYGKTFVLALGKVGKDAVNITITNSEGEILFKEKVKEVADFTKRYNFNTLSNGEYKMTLTKQLITIEQPITINGSQLIIDESLRRETYRPAIMQKGNQVNVNLLLNNFQDIELIVRSLDQKEVYRDNVKSVITFHKRYDLSNLPSGDYELVIQTKDNVFYQKISVEAPAR